MSGPFATGVAVLDGDRPAGRGGRALRGRLLVFVFLLLGLFFLGQVKGAFHPTGTREPGEGRHQSESQKCPAYLH